MKNYLSIVLDSINKNKAQFLRLCKKPTNSFSLSLPTKKDNLTHWDRYASGCSGVCIAFNVAALEVFSQRMSITSLGNNLFDIEHVYYSPDQIEEKISELLMDFINLSINYKKLSVDDSFNSTYENGFLYASVVCQRLMRFSKNRAFFDEDEVRLYFDSNSIKDTIYLIDSISHDLKPELYVNLKQNLLDMVDQLNLKKEYFYLSGKGIRNYRELNLKEVWGAGTIPEIILGPLCVQNRSEFVKFLKENGLESTKVTISKVPIR